jgi:hypothetical protein
MTALIIIGFLAGGYAGYRVGIWHGLRRLGSAELHGRLGNIKANRLRNRNK